MSKRVADGQLDLFGESSRPAPANEGGTDLPSIDADAQLAARLPASVRLGTSSWSFPGWRGVLFPSALAPRDVARRGLEEYAKNPLFRAVGIDRSFYAPVDDVDLATYARQIEVGDREARMRCPAALPLVALPKVFSGVTAPIDPKTQQPSATFLDAGLIHYALLGPLARSFAGHVGGVLIGFSPMRPALPPREFAARIGAFIGELPTAFRYAVEVRNAEYLIPEYFAALERAGAAHVVNLWERMPRPSAQLALPRVLTARLVVVRLTQPVGRSYEAQRARFAPFDKIVEADDDTRRAVVALVRKVDDERRELIVTVNNKVEGCAPETVRAIARAIVAG